MAPLSEAKQLETLRGLLQMRESARLIGAQLSLDSGPAQGTGESLRIPVA